MNSVIFETKDSYKDFGLLLRPKKRPKPSPKSEYVSIPGRNGDLDFTEWAGEIFYNNLEFPLEFYMVDALNEWDSKLRTITNYLHGKQMKVIFSDEPDYYYFGRVKVNELSSDRRLGILSLSCTFEPFKYKKNITSKSYTVSAGKNYTFENERMNTTPTLTLSGAMTIEFEGTSYSLTAGTSKILDIRFKEGTNTIKVTTGTGTLKAEYQEGSL